MGSRLTSRQPTYTARAAGPTTEQSADAKRVVGPTTGQAADATRVAGGKRYFPLPLIPSLSFFYLTPCIPLSYQGEGEVSGIGASPLLYAPLSYFHLHYSITLTVQGRVVISSPLYTSMIKNVYSPIPTCDAISIWKTAFIDCILCPAAPP